MKVLVPFVPGGLHEATLLALEQDRQNPDYVDVSASNNAYFDVLLRTWESGETFVVIEQDIVVWPGAIAKMTECREPWCATDYLTCGYFQYGLGCTKFEGWFTQQHPEAFRRMMKGIDFSSADLPTHWSRLDAQLGLVLSSIADRAWPHRHSPPVTHLNPSHFFPGGHPAQVHH